MSNTYLQAADDARRFLRGFAAVKELADAFEQAGTLEQARSEAEAALAAVTPKLAEAHEQLAAAQAGMLEAGQASAQTIIDAKAAADAVMAAAYADAAAARADADSTCERARARAASIVSEAEGLALAVSDTRDKLALEVTALELRAADARAYLAKLQG